MILFLHSLKSSGYDLQALLYSVQAAAYALGYQAARSRVHAPPGLYLTMFVTYLFLSIVHRLG